MAEPRMLPSELLRALKIMLAEEERLAAKWNKRSSDLTMRHGARAAVLREVLAHSCDGDRPGSMEP